MLKNERKNLSHRVSVGGSQDDDSRPVSEKLVLVNVPVMDKKTGKVTLST